ncbi:hypothetical protein DFH07DRAFT_1015398 [Mycena maculata]|uniref:Uncharacterized protein n=1 Tax=Mycena maculata TaxID=230809 RepID=A0AAD7H9H8_9AGAR|nr:hypothetical protein DFH07DRAFT_1015398 [Mycena maculata]
MVKKVDHRTRHEMTAVCANQIMDHPGNMNVDMQVDWQPDIGTPPLHTSSSPPPAGGENQLSRIQVEIEYHPHSGKAPTIIPLDSTHASGESTSTRLKRQLVPAGRPPWAPFPSRADFEWAETMYMAPSKNVAAQLKGMHSNWCGNSYLTIKTVDDLRMYLERAKHYVVEFHEREFEEIFEGELWHFKFFYRDPWNWLLDTVSDPTLSDEIVWYPSLANTSLWMEIDSVSVMSRTTPTNVSEQSTLPCVAGLPHCLLPCLLWLDKGRVSSHTNMHPMILRPLFLRSKIRNASGNGGGELAGFMVQVRDRKDSDDRSQASKIRFAKFKRDVYHRVLRIVFVETLQEQAFGGKCVTCGDAVRRVLYPRIPILSLDGEEACTCAATRSSLADFPCPRCLVRQDQLHDFSSRTLEFPLRTTATMKAVYEQARGERFKGDAEELLQGHGLHSTENAFWSLEGSDPYDAISYDTLHADDTGKWGKHLWPLLQDVLSRSGLKGMITANMAKVPRWPGLKHFENVTTKDINDGQSWLDIEKCILPCVVQLLPRNSPFVHAIRAHLLTRMMMGLHCISEEQIKRKDNYQEEYGKYCNMTDLDAIREAMALIRMTVDQYDLEISQWIAELSVRANVSPDDIEEVPDAPDEHHWRLGAPQSQVNSKFALKNALWIDNATRHSFDSDLRNFIRDTFPDELLREDGEETITVNHEERFDCVAINMDDDPLTFGRMLFLFRSRLPSGRTEDIALVRLFKKSTWRPKTLWKNCRIYEDGRTMLILPRYFVRGAHMAAGGIKGIGSLAKGLEIAKYCFQDRAISLSFRAHKPENLARDTLYMSIVAQSKNVDPPSDQSRNLNRETSFSRQDIFWRLGHKYSRGNEDPGVPDTSPSGKTCSRLDEDNSSVRTVHNNGLHMQQAQPAQAADHDPVRRVVQAEHDAADVSDARCGDWARMVSNRQGQM